ncbi:putative ATP-dependent rna helicase [Echria macrotheca]|uniref:RNA helicase n=1 Tax=Echria macrotheca TaxID=438768 RepID=A0AAJ0BKI6_9PEZI|nr:putative ATP-dependent rna helicase [Echria macrotheca]
MSTFGEWGPPPSTGAGAQEDAWGVPVSNGGAADAWGAPAAANASTADDAWGTNDLAEALPTDTNPDATANNADAKAPTESAPVVQVVPEAHEGWTQPRPYDYTNAPNEWASNAMVYEWDGEMGDVGPEHPDLEVMLFGAKNEKAPSHGLDFSKIAEIAVYQEGPVRINPIMTFDAAGLHPVMLRNIELSRYQVPTPIQKYCIPTIKQGKDLIAIAQTGSGKTAAYLIPIIDKLMGKARKLCAPRPNPATYRVGIDPPCRAEPLVVVVCPSRELAVQIFNEARKFCYRSMLRPCVAYGGGPVRDQIDQLQKGCDILIASPGRLIDFIERPDVLTLKRLMYMVVDEADEMLHADWEEEFKKIMTGGGSTEQEDGQVKYMFFSATFPKQIRDLAKTYLMENHVRIRVGRAGSTHENIKQNVIMVDPGLKKKALFDLLNSLPPTRTIIFTNSKRSADDLDDFLYNKGIPCTSIHADRTQKEREASMRAFRSGDSPVLIATGVAGRGIDVRNVMHVINYDLPSIEYGGIEEYTHRIGRTGRIGHRGLATSFFTDKDEGMASVLTRTLLETNQTIPDFLEAYVPEGPARENLKFEADSDFEEDTGGDDGTGGGWGGAGGESAPNNDGWGAAAKDEGESQANNNGWGEAVKDEGESQANNNGWGAPAEAGGGWGASGSAPTVPGW